MKQTTYFNTDNRIGKQGELIFQQDFLDERIKKYVDVSKELYYRGMDVDYVVNGKVKTEVKANYKDDGFIVIEERANYPECDGWYYTSKADVIVFVSVRTRQMIFLKFDDNFKKHYRKIKVYYELIKNRPSVNEKGEEWQSAFRRIPLSAIEGHYFTYKK